MITVTSMGNEKKELSFLEGMRVGDALGAAKIELPKNFTLSVNGAEAKGKTELKDGDVIVVTPKVANG